MTGEPLGECWELQLAESSWGEPGAPVQPHPRGEGGAGGAQPRCLWPPSSLGAPAAFCPFPSISWETCSSSQALCGCGQRWKKPKDCGSRSQGHVRPSWAVQGFCLSWQSWLTKFIYRIVRFHYMKYLYFLVICSF